MYGVGSTWEQIRWTCSETIPDHLHAPGNLTISKKYQHEPMKYACYNSVRHCVVLPQIIHTSVFQGNSSSGVRPEQHGF